MAIETICSGCGQRLSVADESAGKQARCPSCGQIYTIPHPTSSSPLGDAGADWPKTSSNPVKPSSASASFDPDSSEASSPIFWMKTAEGVEYGPVDQATLGRWFREGRIGPGYQIRQHEYGHWQTADAFRPVTSGASANPYADNPYQASAAGPGMYTYPKADQAGLILTMGILSLFLCPIFGVVAWIMGHTALRDIRAGRADPRNKGMVQVGYYLGMAGVILGLLCFGGYIAAIMIAIIAQGM